MATNGVQAYLDFIRTIGLEAWIPDSPGHGPKMSVTDQCRCGVLCLDYKGSEIYIRSNSCRAMNFAVVTGSLRSGKNPRGDPEKSAGIVAGRANETRNGFVGVDWHRRDGEKADNRVAVTVPSKRSVGVQCGGCCYSDENNFHRALISHHSEPVTITGHYGNSSRTDNVISYSILDTGVQYRRIVTEKLTKEVRVAKCYVSSLPVVADNNCRGRLRRRVDTPPSGRTGLKNADGTDYENRRARAEMSESNSKGFVRKLIQRFNDARGGNHDENRP